MNPTSTTIDITAIEDIRRRFTTLADHYPIVGFATNHDEVSRAEARGYAKAWREAAAYLTDLLTTAKQIHNEEGDTE